MKQRLLLNIPRVYPDELLFSWVRRITDINAMRDFVFISMYFDVGFRNSAQIPLDIRQGFYNFMKTIGFEWCMDEVYLALSTFQFESIAMTENQQMRYAHNVFRPLDKLNPPAIKAFPTLKICPECMKEDIENFGVAYFHRAHQLSGVCACHKHGVPLHEFKGKRGHAWDFDAYEPLPDKKEGSTAYARYAKALLDSGIHTDSRAVKRIIFDRMNMLGYSVSDSYKSFISAFEKWEYSNLWEGGDMYHFLRYKLPDPRFLFITEVIPLFMFLFPDVSNLIPLFAGHEPLLERRTCPKCGEIYVTTPYAEKTGWGCPYCDSGIPEKERFKHLVSVATDDEYEPLSEFTSLMIKMPFFHKSCGKQIEITPRNLLFDGRRCPCEKTILESEARKAVEANPGFKLISYSGTMNPAVIYHEDCGQEFSCRFERFMASPFCRACEHTQCDTDTFADRVRALVGDEYTVVGEYKSSNADVAIRHNICGHTQKYRASRFTAGQRCKYCSGHLSRSDIEDMLSQYSGSRYVLQAYEKEKCFILDKTTDKAICMPPLLLVQEMTRVTPSEILPSDDGKPIKRVGAWEKNYALLIKHKDETGVARIPRRMSYHGVSLGNWCSNQKQAYKRGELNSIQAKQLLAFDPTFFDKK